MFSLKATPTVYIGEMNYADQYFDGSDGKLYDDSDLPWLIAKLGEPRTRKTKYGTSYYWKEGSVRSLSA